MSKAIVSESKTCKRKKDQDEAIRYALTNENHPRYTYSDDDVKMLYNTPNWMAVTPTSNKVCRSLDKTFASEITKDGDDCDEQDDKKCKGLLKGMNAERRSLIHFLIEQRNTMRHMTRMIDEEIGRLMEGIDFTYDELDLDIDEPK